MPRSRRGLAIPADEAILTSGQSRASACMTCSRPSSSASRRRKATPNLPLKALIFDSYFDAYRGVVALIRVVDGSSRPVRIRFMATKNECEVEEVVCVVRPRRRR